MTQQITQTCAGCGVPHTSPWAIVPTGWRVINGELRCGDCQETLIDIAPPIAAPTGPDHRCETALPLLSGPYIDLADPDCSVIAPIDIAAGLRNARFCGQTRRFYTIAQHSLLVLHLVSPAARSLGGEKGLQLRRCALMHDAAEAIIHDITAPLKRELPDYRAIEARFETRLAARFGFEWTQWRRERVKQADIEALAIEQRDIVRRADAWPIFDGLDRSKLAANRITRCWHPDEAMDRFLAAFAELFPNEERMAA